MIYITADHAGFELKNKLLAYLKKQGFEVSDEGPFELKLGDDYPDYIYPVMEKVQFDPESRAIVICKNGVGVSIYSNKFDGIRAALSWNEKHAISSRNDDNTNVLALPADYISEEEAYGIAEAWINTPFSEEERHKRRLQKIESSSLWKA